MKPEVLITAMFIKTSIFWDVTPCILVEFRRSFERTLCLQFQDQGVSPTSKQLAESACCLLFAELKSPLNLNYSARSHIPKDSKACYSKLLIAPQNSR
jgi:hypothetical protein